MNSPKFSSRHSHREYSRLPEFQELATTIQVVRWESGSITSGGRQWHATVAAGKLVFGVSGEPAIPGWPLASQLM